MNKITAATLLRHIAIDMIAEFPNDKYNPLIGLVYGNAARIRMVADELEIEEETK